jgi:hypothetical protein
MRPFDYQKELVKTFRLWLAAFKDVGVAEEGDLTTIIRATAEDEELCYARFCVAMQGLFLPLKATMPIKVKQEPTIVEHNGQWVAEARIVL